MSTHSVYWIHLPEMNDPTTQGYVGVTNNMTRRIKTHISHLRNNNHINTHLQRAFNIDSNFVFTVLYEGNDLDCYLKESELRPETNVGWNLCEGGSRPPVGLRTYGPLAEAHKRKLRENHKGMKGKEHSQATKEKMSQAAKNRVATEATRCAISASKAGKNNPMYGVARGDDTKARIQKTNKVMAELRREFSQLTGTPYKKVTKQLPEFDVFVKRARSSGRFDGP